MSEWAWTELAGNGYELESWRLWSNAITGIWYIFYGSALMATRKNLADARQYVEDYRAGKIPKAESVSSVPVGIQRDELTEVA